MTQWDLNYVDSQNLYNFETQVKFANMICHVDIQNVSYKKITKTISA